MTKNLRLAIIIFFIIPLFIGIFAMTNFPIVEILKCNNEQCKITQVKILNSNAYTVLRYQNKVSVRLIHMRRKSPVIYELKPSIFYTGYCFKFNAQRHANIINSNRNNFTIVKLNFVSIACLLLMLISSLAIWFGEFDDFKSL